MVSRVVNTSASSAAGNAPVVGTRGRILDAALASFTSRGFEATALDALGASLGLTKQTILHHFGSKDQLLAAVLERTVQDLAARIEERVARAPQGWPALDAVVREVFTLASQRPELLSFLREVGRLDSSRSAQLARELAPMTVRAHAFLVTDFPHLNDAAARNAVLSGYAAMLGVVTEFEVLRQVGGKPSARLLLRRRRELLAYLAGLIEAKAE